MNPIIALLKQHNVSDDKIKETFKQITENPMMLMASIGSLGIPPEQLQTVMMSAMEDPKVIVDAVEELGLDFSQVEKAKESMNK